MRVDVLKSYDGSAKSDNCPRWQENAEFYREEMQSSGAFAPASAGLNEGSSPDDGRVRKNVACSATTISCVAKIRLSTTDFL
jgi:hypothetical protein